MPRELNGVTREFGSDDASRWAHFRINQCLVASVNQKADEATLTMASPTASWASSYNFGDNQIVHAELLVEALRQAIALARKWEADAGKPYNKVLQGE